MDAFEALLKLILDEKSLKDIKSKIGKEVKLKVGADTSGAKADAEKFVTELSRLSKANTMQTWADNNSKAVKKYSAEITKLIRDMKNLDVNLTKEQSENITKRFREIQVEARNTGNIGKTAADKFKTAWEKFGGWGIATGAFMKMKTEFVDGIKFIKRLDDALADVAYTSDISKAGLKNLGKSSIEMAKDLHISADRVLEAVKIYSTANSTAEDILRKAKPALMLSNVSGMSGTQSSKMINTAINQFEIEDTAENLMDVVDTIEYVSGQLNYDFTKHFWCLI